MRSLLSDFQLTLFFFFHAPSTTEIYTLSLHDALPIFDLQAVQRPLRLLCLLDRIGVLGLAGLKALLGREAKRSEEHTSELQSRPHLVCRLLLEKKNPIAVKALKHAATPSHTSPLTASV